MIRNGTKPAPLDNRDFSFHKTFGGVGGVLPIMEYTLDISRTMPDQNADGYPYGCTGYTQADICTDEDGTIYKPSYTYLKTCYMEGHEPNTGCDVRTSIKSTIVYGVQGLAEDTDIEAETHRRGQYFNVNPDGGMDWFDAFRTAMRTNKRPISVGTPWLPAWEGIGQDGVIPSVFTLSGSESWHNWKVCGEKMIDNTPYLIGKSWQGNRYGHGGLCYFDRGTINQTMAVRGSVAFTFAQANPQDIQTIKISIYETALLYLYRILGLVRHA